MKFFKIRHFVFFLMMGVALGIGNSLCLADQNSLGTLGTNDTLQAMASVLAVVIKFLTFISLLIMSWGGELLGTEFLTSETAMNGIRPMWVYMRNITNICFVVVLLFLSFSNLFSFGGGSWTIKEKLPKIIISLVAVNFSLLAFRVVLDAVNVGSTAILTIADTAVTEKGDFDVASILSAYSNEKGGICDLSYEQKTALKTKSKTYVQIDKEMMEKEGCKPFYKSMNDLMCSKGITDDECFFQVKSPTDVKKQAGKPTTSNLLLSFGVYFQHLEQLPALAANLKDFSSVLDSVVFSSVMALAYVVALVAVFIALLMRIVALWFFMIFSPLLMAAWIMGIGGGGDISGKLVTYLIMPLKIAAAFSLSFVMIAVLIDFQPVDSIQIINPGKALSQFSGDSMFGILWKIATVVVFWTAAFKALDGTHVEGFINNIKTKAEGAGSFLTKAATVDRQVLKFPGMDRVSLSSLSKLPDALGELQRTRNSGDYMQMKRDFKLTNLSSGDEKKSKNLDNISKESTAVDGLRKSLDQFSSSSELTNSNVAMQAKLIQTLERIGKYDSDSIKKLEEDFKTAGSGASASAAIRTFIKTNTDKRKISGIKESDYTATNWVGSGTNSDKEKGPEKQERFFYTKENGKIDYSLALVDKNGKDINESQLGRFFEDVGLSEENIQKLHKDDVENLADQLIKEGLDGKVNKTQIIAELEKIRTKTEAEKEPKTET